MGIGLSIVFTGLCALVTNGDHTAGTVLLVDARGVGEVRGIALPDHAPTLVLDLASLANAETSHPTRVVAGGLSGGQVGIWDLTGSEVFIRIQGGAREGVELFQPQAAASWPEAPSNVNDADSWRDMRFVANMKSLVDDPRIDPALVGAGGDPRVVMPPAVAARIHLDAGLLEAGVPSHEAYRGDVFEFRATGKQPKLRQALTDTIRWSVATASDVVVVEIVPLAGGAIKRLVLAPTVAAHNLFISNLPAENATHSGHQALSGEELAALHFGAYYALLKSQPLDRPLPRPWSSPSGRSGTGLMGPVLCPPAMFTMN